MLCTAREQTTTETLQYSHGLPPLNHKEQASELRLLGHSIILVHERAWSSICTVPSPSALSQHRTHAVGPKQHDTRVALTGLNRCCGAGSYAHMLVMASLTGDSPGWQAVTGISPKLFHLCAEN